MNKSAIAYILTALLILITPLWARAEEDFTYRPNIHGTIRSRAEISTLTGDYRFQVRNARLTLDGKVAPSISYFLNTDLCDQGKMKILDAWAKVGIVKGLALQAGQFRMPFGIDPFRAPHQYYFSNRSFIGKQMCNYRRVGAKGVYSFPGAPVVIEAGVFNPTAMGDHAVWNSRVDAAGMVSYSPGAWKFSAGGMSICPAGLRANLLDAAGEWHSGNMIVGAEYMLKHYTHHAHKDAHAYQLFGSYAWPVKVGVFDSLGAHARFDGLTAHSDATVVSDNGLLSTTEPARNRITAGMTLGYLHAKNIFVDIRLDYEKYFYHSDTKPTADMGDKAVVELVLRF